jgi:hypothetical protein
MVEPIGNVHPGCWDLLQRVRQTRLTRRQFIPGAAAAGLTLTQLSRVHIVVLLKVMFWHVAPTVNARSHGLPTDPVDTPDPLGGEIVPGAVLPLALVKLNEAPFCATVSVSPIPTDGQYTLQT